MKQIYIETLGCSKNQVDSEKMLFLLKNNGYNITGEPEKADIIIINTCGFIKSAKQESIETILELAEYKKTGKCKKLIAAGCLAQYYPKPIKEEIPEIDVVFGIGSLTDILNAVKKSNKIIIHDFLNDEITGRELIGIKGSAYLKISDGCSNFCSYCLIPKIRGNFRSRKMDKILSEVDFLKSKNINEINIISQDTANYGTDIYKKKMLAELISEIDKMVNNDCWIRVLYMHPDHIDSKMLEYLAKSKKFLPYFDLPFQSGNNKILKLMNRKGNQENYLKLLKIIKEIFINPVFRTTFITGFPGETDKDFKETFEFLKKAQIDWTGGFTYSREDNTEAGIMKGQIKESIKKKRLKELLDESDKITSKRLQRFIGSREKIFIEEKIEGENLYFGRFWGQAPEVDGLTLVNTENAQIGSFINADIIKLNNKDFFAKP
ncbi:MAG: 30S ribosomal protein S12 methylthiotransferase RimO [Spirochaetes bacterium]|nr:30S ribosomal protein S12 methylthiotransferase RimO [Spirochaetota bacterium]